MTARVIRDVRVVVVPWIVSRALVGVGYVIAHSLGTSLSKHGVRGNTVDLFGWDAGFYRTIARHGYDAVSATDGLRFFPLYPVLGRAFGSSDAVMLGISNLATLVALVLILRLGRAWLNDESAARRATWIIALGPGATATVMGYAEPLFLVLAVACALALHHDRIALAGAFGAGAALTRPVGIMLVVMFLARGVATKRLRPTLGAIGPVAGLSAFLTWSRDFSGDWLRPLQLQGQSNLRGENVDPITAIWSALRYVIVDHRIGPGLHLMWAAVAIIVCFIAYRRLPLPGSAFAAAVVLLSLTTRNLDSYERYLLSAFPLAIAAASVRMSNTQARMGAGVLGVLVVGYSSLAFGTVYVP